MTVTGTIRFLFGTALVAAGAILCAPLVTKLAAAGRDPVSGPTSPGPALDAVPVGRQPPTVAVAAPVAPSVDVASGVPPAAEGAGAALAGPAPPDSAGGLQLDRCPPPPPIPLPTVPAELYQTVPSLGGAYRSTLDVPPPPLLDAERSPPPVSSAAPRPVAAPAPVAGTVAGVDVTVPATYRVRDGDDLGAIAGRFYGHPAAASAIWAANRDTIPHPDLLPIGAELRLPPPWAVGARHQAGTIEPVSYARPVAAPVSAGHATQALDPDAVPWLLPAVERGPAASAAPHPLRDVSDAAVVGPGESLESLARRIYGDPAMAAQIFAVNRDRLRSPELVVAGMELRLPRAIRASGP